ncbi:class I SAM-dependent methyltransferase [Caulobacter mirabilis]|uniref:Methyltransferase n=1 Tax=Caulobacter mirabilis TaxID=69666 RepID=A0A2D2AXS8_9CAUL|nr:methyltransferase domain-containing protein [Caulobacter mirabilis]ATQ42747.1 methyltransferase [Caulobacter mirabilis]
MTFNRADFYDAELRRHDEPFYAALGIGSGDRVLDIGCGAGKTTRDAARMAGEGGALGVDVSEEMLRVARLRSIQEGLGNVSFELADAQVAPFPAGGFDLCISRFGVMFFAEPDVAFANIARAMRPGARLVMLVWQDRDRNEWATAIRDALAPGEPPPSGGPAFSLADRMGTSGVLTEAGFASIDFADVHEPVFYGPDADAAYDAVVELFAGRDILTDPTPEAGRTRERLRSLVEAHSTSDGVLFDSRAWLVTARRA